MSSPRSAISEPSGDQYGSNSRQISRSIPTGCSILKPVPSRRTVPMYCAPLPSPDSNASVVPSGDHWIEASVRASSVTAWRREPSMRITHTSCCRPGDFLVGIPAKAIWVPAGETAGSRAYIDGVSRRRCVPSARTRKIPNTSSP
ncbi:MAG: hypothetical protein M3273_01450 [Actinomycetota bacterium]|nr:hypothetical protein [Actinomycetota bacterium]